MKFYWRLYVLGLILLTAVLLWYTMKDSVYMYTITTKDTNPLSAKGLQISLIWELGSLRQVHENDRLAFRELYTDDRLFFGDGIARDNDAKIRTKSPIKPDTDRAVVFDERTYRTLLQNKLHSSSSLEHSDNLKRILLSADVITSNKNIPKKTLKSVLLQTAHMMESIGNITHFGQNFKLKENEKSLLARAMKQSAKPKVATESTETIIKPREHSLVNLPPAYSRSRHHHPEVYYFYSGISNSSMYSEHIIIDRILRKLETLKPTYFEFRKNSTRLRGKLKLGVNVYADFIPLRFSRTQETRVNQRHQDDFQRHIAEIAAFHLDRVLGFRRAVPTAGRIFQIFNDLKPVYQGNQKLSPFVTSLEGNDCLVGICKFHCGSNEMICGTPDQLEVAAMLQISRIAKLTHPYPWADVSDKNSVPQWKKDPGFCGVVKAQPKYSSGRRLLDIVDLAVFDFLQDNRDRTTYNTFADFGTDSFIIHNDNEMGFGRAFRDDTSILAPLYQCCMIRAETLHTLMVYALGPDRLSEVMYTSLSRDALQPVLLKQHLLALDRRLNITLKVVYECLQRNPSNSRTVVIHDAS